MGVGGGGGVTVMLRRWDNNKVIKNKNYKLSW